jgi:deazaflavin-dependent oxidoreductase (nitroreductase family)
MIELLDYQVPKPTSAQRAMWHVSSSRPGAWVFARSLHHLDRRLLQASHGRYSVPGILAGIPVITVTTTGARSGQPRSSPLLGIPVGDDLAVIGTHFGQRGTPGWYYNLRAHPAAEVAYHGKAVTAVARELQGDEWSAAWAQARKIYAGYEAYARRIHDRQIHILVLSVA